jgi:hypothetical protein
VEEIESDVREILRTTTNNETRILRLSRYINELLDHEAPALYVTGVPGLAVDHEEESGVRIGRNCNGSIVEVEIVR